MSGSRTIKFRPPILLPDVQTNAIKAPPSHGGHFLLIQIAFYLFPLAYAQRGNSLYWSWSAMKCSTGVFHKKLKGAFK